MRKRETRVVIRFPSSTELVTLDRPPLPGHRITDRDGSVWFVVDVVQSGLETYTVRCAAERLLREHHSEPEELAAGLRATVRRAARPIVPPTSGEGDYRGFKRQDDWIDRYLARSHGGLRPETPSRVKPVEDSRSADDWIEKYLGSADGPRRPVPPRGRTRLLARGWATLGG